MKLQSSLCPYAPHLPHGTPSAHSRLHQDRWPAACRVLRSFGSQGPPQTRIHSLGVVCGHSHPLLLSAQLPWRGWGEGHHPVHRLQEHSKSAAEYPANWELLPRLSHASHRQLQGSQAWDHWHSYMLKPPNNPACSAIPHHFPWPARLATPPFPSSEEHSSVFSVLPITHPAMSAAPSHALAQPYPSAHAAPAPHGPGHV